MYKADVDYSWRKGGAVCGRALFKLAARGLICIQLFASGFWGRGWAGELLCYAKHAGCKNERQPLECQVNEKGVVPEKIPNFRCSILVLIWV